MQKVLKGALQKLYKINEIKNGLTLQMQLTIRQQIKFVIWCSNQKHQKMG